MGDGISLAGLAMVAREQRQEALVHNLANASTPGFKAARVFAKVLEDACETVEGMRRPGKGPQVYIDFGQGRIEATDRNLDLALDGEGFFVVGTPEGERYTRNGNFSLDADGRLVNASGHPVLTESGPITIGDGEITVDAGGEISLDGQFVGQLSIKNFESLDPLVQAGAGLYGPGPGVELVEIEPTAVVLQGSLEASNVLPLEEMVRMTTLLKQFEACHRMVEMQDTVLRRTVSDLILR